MYTGRPNKPHREGTNHGEGVKWEPCPDCNLRDDLRSSPGISNDSKKRGDGWEPRHPVHVGLKGVQPMAIRGDRHSSVKDCETCGGKGRIRKKVGKQGKPIDEYTGE